MFNILTARWVPTDDGMKTVSEMLVSENLKTSFVRVEYNLFFELFLSGVVQTFFCPKDKEALSHLYDNRPDQSTIEKTFLESPLLAYFDLYDNEFPFMQYAKICGESESPTYAETHALFAGNYKRNGKNMPTGINLGGWFNSVRHVEESVCEDCSGLFMFGYQLSARMCGEGHYTAIGGDKTLFSSFYKDGCSSWQNAVLNTKPYHCADLSDNIGWKHLRPAVKIENRKTGRTYSPVDIRSPIYSYWQSPRKILLDRSLIEPGWCGCCGKEKNVYKIIRRAAFGLRYDGACYAPFKSFLEYTKDNVKMRKYLKLNSDASYFEMVRVFTDYELPQPPDFEQHAEIKFFGEANDGDESDTFILKKFQKWIISHQEKTALNIFANHVMKKVEKTQSACKKYKKRNCGVKNTVSNHLLNSMDIGNPINIDDVKKYLDEVNRICVGVFDEFTLSKASANPKGVAKARLLLKRGLMYFNKSQSMLEDDIIITKMKNALKDGEDLGDIFDD